MLTRLLFVPLVIAAVFTASSASAVPDHLQCFKIKDAAAKAAYTATFSPRDSTFPVSSGCEVKVPAKLLCVDSAKSGVIPTPPGSGDGNPAQQYLCYKAKCPKSEVAATATDQFGSRALTVKTTSLVCAPLVFPIHCFDEAVSGDETDLECGGSCRDCGIEKDCLADSDCAIGNCVAGTCAFPSCSDSRRNGNESDVDCGGSCGTCTSGLDCASGGDCASGYCDSGTCGACSLDADCEPEGYCSGGDCLPLVGAACASGASCPSGFCIDGVCCDTSCASSCEACTFAKKQAGESGTCGEIAAGTDPDAECPGTDVCVAGSCSAPVVAGQSSVAIARADSCGEAGGRTCESLIGHVISDAMRSAVAADFAIVNAGALRADLTCPAAGNTSCDPYAPPPHVITAGEVHEVLPFANRIAVTTVTGDVLKFLLENGVSLAPAAAGRFPQVSGLCVTYDIALPAGSRVTGVVHQAVDGACTGPAVDLTVTGSYDLAINDFMAGGGDGYPDILGSSTLGQSIWRTTIDHLGLSSPLSPALQSRVVCTDSNGATAPNCAP